MPIRRRTQVVLACLALTFVLVGLAALRRTQRASGEEENPGRSAATGAEDPRDQAATMPDPRGRSLYPDASCLAPDRMPEGSAPRCVVSFGRAMTAVGLERGGTLAITSLAHAATVGWSLPAATATLLFEPLPADAEARAILVDEPRRRAVSARPPSSTGIVPASRRWVSRRVRRWSRPTTTASSRSGRSIRAAPRRGAEAGGRPLREEDTR
jgi:hypothetical protein